jgi:hypothetical protein
MRRFTGGVFRGLGGVSHAFPHVRIHNTYKIVFRYPAVRCTRFSLPVSHAYSVHGGVGYVRKHLGNWVPPFPRYVKHRGIRYGYPGEALRMQSRIAENTLSHARTPRCRTGTSNLFPLYLPSIRRHLSTCGMCCQRGGEYPERPTCESNYLQYRTSSYASYVRSVPF